MNISKTSLPESVIQPTFDRSKLSSRIVHLGFGAFHRAHQSLITNEMLDKTNSDWGICEINLFGGEDLIKQLREQDHMYAVMERGSDENKVKLIKSITESLHPALDGMEKCIEKMCEEQVSIVSMTITEKGYCASPSSGKLDFSNPMIQFDINNPRTPKTAIGLIVEALRIRKERGQKAFTVLACDNIQNNGKVAKTVILEYARQLDTKLYQWINDNVTFPCTMVDRIVPAATEETLTEIANALEVNDPCSIACEPFLQWVIEDDFVDGRPDWNVVDGVTFVEDVVPYEEMKLRMLNGTHSLLAYLGYLAGYEHISDTMTNDDFRKLARHFMLEVQAPTLNMPEGTDLVEYADLLIDRFTNPSLKHQTWQIAMDGSQKLPQRWVESIRFHIANGGDLSVLSVAVAAWIRYISGVDEKTDPIDVRDPMKKIFEMLFTRRGIKVEVVKPILGLTAIFGEDIIENSEFVEQVEMSFNQLRNIRAKNVASVVARSL